MKQLLIVTFLLVLLTTRAQQRQSYSNGDRQTTGLGLTLGGVAFSAAALLEGGTSYGTNVVVNQGTPTTSQTVKYVIPPFWKQTPRQIMFVTGVTLTITGLFTALSK